MKYISVDIDAVTRSIIRIIMPVFELGCTGLTGSGITVGDLEGVTEGVMIGIMVGKSDTGMAEGEGRMLGIVDGVYEEIDGIEVGTSVFKLEGINVGETVGNLELLSPWRKDCW